jgi:MFS family permease
MSIEQVSTIQKDKRGQVSSLYWAGILVWAGLVFGADSLGILPQVGRSDAWNWVFFGTGLYTLLACVFVAASPKLSHPTTWSYVWGGALLILGLGGLTSLAISSPLVLLLVGTMLLFTTLLQR